MAEEEPDKPLSDSRIAEILSREGVLVARRTVAKYREALQEALPDDIRAVVQRQYDGVVKNHDQIRDLRNRFRSQQR